MGGNIRHALPLGASEEDIVRKKPSISRDVEVSILTDEGLPVSPHAYYYNVNSTGGGILPSNADIEHSGDIFTTGILP